jgi:hypothetical protein
MEARPRKNLQSKVWFVLLLLICAVGLLCAFQFGDRYGLNSMPYAQVQQFVSDLPKAQHMASEGNIEMLAGQTPQGKALTLRGEITDANCFLAEHTHAYDHAFCAKLCVAAGSPLVFIPDQGGPIYVVLTGHNGVRIPDAVLNQIGVPGILFKGRVLESNGVSALALDGIVQ